MKQLNDKELAKINLNDLDFELASEKLKSAVLETKILELQSRLLAHEMEKKKNQVAELRKIEAEKREIKQDFLKTIAKKKDLAPGWGFNPDNGQIVEGDD